MGPNGKQGLVDVLRPDAVRILDFPHAVEHLTAAAEPVFGNAAAELHAWLDEQAHTLKHAVDGARQVLNALAKLPVQRAADPNAAAGARDRTMAYFTKRLAQVRYAEFRAAGYPIGSESTESANKVVVEARLKGSGMHWARAHVDPLVALRTVACTNRWAEAWPRITARLRVEARERRHARRQMRHAMPATPYAELTHPASVSRPRPSPTTMPPLANRSKSIINGRPTALHPWKRFGPYRSASGHDLRFPR
jgi:hypothetical protein